MISCEISFYSQLSALIRADIWKLQRERYPPRLYFSSFSYALTIAFTVAETSSGFNAYWLNIVRGCTLFCTFDK